MNNADTVNKYLVERQANEIDEKTLELESLILRQLGAFLTKPYEHATKEDMMVFFNGMQKNYAPGTVHLYKFRVKRFYNWLFQLEQGQFPECVKWIKPSNPTKRHSLELPIKPEEILTPEEVKRLVNASMHPRDQALIMLLYESAARSEEILNLKINNVTFDNLGAKITLEGEHGARNIRIVDSVPYLQAWLNVHPYKNNEAMPLWIAKITGRPTNKKNDNIGYDNLYRMLNLLKKRTGIKKPVRPHLLRHARLTFLAKHLTDAQLKTYAGWTPGSRMTGVYVHLSGKDLDEPILAMHGLAMKEKPKEAFERKTCVRGHENQGEAIYCNVCGITLDRKKALEVMNQDEERDKEIDLLKTKIENLETIMQAFTKGLTFLREGKVKLATLKDQPELIGFAPKDIEKAAELAGTTPEKIEEAIKKLKEIKVQKTQI